MKRTDELKLEQLERTLGEQLRQMPSPVPTDSLRARLGATALAAPKRRPGWNRQPASHSAWRWPRLGMVMAGLLVVTLIGWGLAPRLSDDTPIGLGPLLVHSVAGANDTLSFRLGQDSLRLIDWTGLDRFPSLPASAPVQRLRRPELTEQHALEMAALMGFEQAKVQRTGDMTVVIGEEVASGEGVDADRLYLDLRQGTWHYSRGYRPPQAATFIDAGQAKQLVLEWLASIGQLPSEYQVEVKAADHGPGAYLVSLRPPAGPMGMPVLGRWPSLVVTVNPDGSISAAEGAWYEDVGESSLPIIDYAQALEALRRGEGEFVSSAFYPLVAGQAKVEQASMAYQLAFALDDTPYLVPVAVFGGQYVAEGGAQAEFVAYVSLLQQTEPENAGNYRLATSLPEAPTVAAMVSERPLAVSLRELTALKEFFRTGGSSDPDYPTETSWNGGWMWRGVWRSSQSFSQPLTEQQAIAVANELVEQLPTLPGELAPPIVSSWLIPENPDVSDSYCHLRFDLIYDGIPTGGPDGAGSYLSLQVQTTDVYGQGKLGAVTMVHLAKPMQLGAPVSLISAEQAWQKLLSNEATVFVEGHLAGLPAARFQVVESEVEQVSLAYVPRHRELARNEHWDLQFIFTGTAKVGDRSLRFTALVDAVESPSR